MGVRMAGSSRVLYPARPCRRRAYRALSARARQRGAVCVCSPAKSVATSRERTSPPRHHVVAMRARAVTRRRMRARRARHVAQQRCLSRQVTPKAWRLCAAPHHAAPLRHAPRASAHAQRAALLCAASARYARQVMRRAATENGCMFYAAAPRARRCGERRRGAASTAKRRRLLLCCCLAPEILHAGIIERWKRRPALMSVAMISGSR